MPRPHKIQIVIRDKKIYARITHVINGKRKELWRSGSTKTEARDRLRSALRDMETLGTSGRYSPKTKFSVVMEWYLSRYAVAPVYVDGRKVSGLRSSDSIRAQARPLVLAFGEQSLGSISHSDLELYKSDRLRVPTVRRKGRSIASVQRELALARHVFNIAEREGWIVRSPFRKGDPLISQADERRGYRIMSLTEEAKLIELCTGKRKHLKAILICAVDTGMRPGEIFQLQWKDVDFAANQINIQSLTTKTIQARPAPVSRRLRAELLNLFDHRMGDSVFNVTTVRRSFNRCCELAGIEHGDPHGLTLRCLRRTAATRWMQGGMSREEVSKLLGHSATTDVTYRHYLVADSATLDRAAKIADGLNQFDSPDKKRA